MIETYFGSDEVVLENFINKVSRHICQKHFSIPTARNFSVQCDHSLFSEKIVFSAQKVSISSFISLPGVARPVLIVGDRVVSEIPWTLK